MIGFDSSFRICYRTEDDLLDTTREAGWEELWQAWHANLEGVREVGGFAQVELELFQRVGIAANFISFADGSEGQIAYWLGKDCQIRGLTAQQAEEWFEENSISWLWQCGGSDAY